jgi:hypothetical protein
VVWGIGMTRGTPKPPDGLPRPLSGISGGPRAEVREGLSHGDHAGAQSFLLCGELQGLARSLPACDNLRALVALGGEGPLPGTDALDERPTDGM